MDSGKPVMFARHMDVNMTVDCLRYFGAYADKFYGETLPVKGEFFAYTRKEPVGVCAQIIPWNFPLYMLA
jgi:aldehyde dehydrogenase (NAD+)